MCFFGTCLFFLFNILWTTFCVIRTYYFIVWLLLIACWAVRLYPVFPLLRNDVMKSWYLLPSGFRRRIFEFKGFFILSSSFFFQESWTRFTFLSNYESTCLYLSLLQFNSKILYCFTAFLWLLSFKILLPFIILCLWLSLYILSIILPSSVFLIIY